MFRWCAWLSRCRGLLVATCRMIQLDIVVYLDENFNNSLCHWLIILVHAQLLELYLWRWHVSLQVEGDCFQLFAESAPTVECLLFSVKDILCTDFGCEVLHTCLHLLNLVTFEEQTWTAKEYGNHDDFFLLKCWWYSATFSKSHVYGWSYMEWPPGVSTGEDYS